MMLQDKVAVVTGAARGIGREIALLMARHGAAVVVNDFGGGADGVGNASGPADEVVSEIKNIGGDQILPAMIFKRVHHVVPLFLSVDPMLGEQARRPQGLSKRGATGACVGQRVRQRRRLG